MRLRDRRLWVLARAAGWSRINLAARLGGGGLEAICDLFGISENEYRYFSPCLPAEDARRSEFVQSREDGLVHARAVIAKRQKSRKIGRRQDRHELLGKLLAKVDAGLARNPNITPQQRRRYRGHFEYLGNRLSVPALRRLVRNVKEIRLFESVEMLNGHLQEQGLEKKRANWQTLGKWSDDLRTLFLADAESDDDFLRSERAIYAHEIAHALDVHPNNKHRCVCCSTPWTLAFLREILSFDEDENLLTEYAKTHISEGFAEFGACHDGSSAC